MAQRRRRGGKGLAAGSDSLSASLHDRIALRLAEADAQVQAHRKKGEQIQKHVQREVDSMRVHIEELTTKLAQTSLSSAGKSSRAKKTRRRL
jgi:hypothetical protein